MDRREDRRSPARFTLTELLGDEPQQALATNLSENGLLVTRLANASLNHRIGLWGRQVGLEFELPGTSEVIWATAACRRVKANPFFLTTGMRFRQMAGFHKRLLHEYLHDHCKVHLPNRRLA